jgi:hypothetical protein
MERDDGTVRFNKKTARIIVETGKLEARAGTSSGVGTACIDRGSGLR